MFSIAVIPAKFRNFVGKLYSSRNEIELLLYPAAACQKQSLITKKQNRFERQLSIVSGWPLTMIQAIGLVWMSEYLQFACGSTIHINIS